MSPQKIPVAADLDALSPFPTVDTFPTPVRLSVSDDAGDHSSSLPGTTLLKTVAGGGLGPSFLSHILTV